MPSRLLSLLTGQPQSGEQLGAALGVGRVTVNTLAHQLSEQGVPVIISRGGYALAAGTPAPPFVTVRGEFGRALRYFGLTDSTQDEARRWADDPHGAAPHGAVVVAEQQSGGRGRRGRTWTTTHGTLAFSLLLRGDEARVGTLSLPALALMPLAAGVALHAACFPAGGGGGLKWPNDLLTHDGRKLAGILLEADLRGEEARRAVLGTGLNVTSAPPGAAALSEFRPGVTRAEVLSDLLAALEHWLAQPPAAVLDAWRASNLTLGQAVEVHTPRGLVVGVAQDIDAQGSLIVETAGGVRQTVNAGDVQLVGQLAASAADAGPSP